MLSRRRFLAAYGALAAVRVLVAFTSLSTIHPDEYFQNPEVAAGLLFSYAQEGDRPLRTWEWRGSSPCRSIVPVLGSTGHAFQLLKLFFGPSPPATALFASQRAVMLLLSFTIDAVVWRVSRRSRLSLLLLASSPVMFTFLLRPFSNTLETVLLAAAYASHVRPDLLDLVSFGAVMAIGIFTRITFAAFALPLSLAVFLRLGQGSSVCFSPVRLATACLPAVVGFVVVALACTGLDTAYFYTGETSPNALLAALASPRSLILTPLNLLRYNASTDNLAKHGLHPRWLHTAVNMPMLFGAGLFIVASGASGLRTPQRGARLKLQDRDDMRLHLASIAVPLALLSALPHQEPRFLVPLIVPLVLLAPHATLWKSGTRRAVKARRAIWTLWLLHSIVFTVLFGYLHQGGLLPAVFAVNKELRDPTTWLGVGHVDAVFWRTFMPPRHLLLPTVPKGIAVPSVHVTDLAGAPVSTLLSTLSSKASTASGAVVLVAPAYAIEAHNLTCVPTSTLAAPLAATDKSSQACLKRLRAGTASYGVQVDMDRLGDLAGATWETAGVGVWTVE